ncbi:YfcL family protein, partial [Salmonella enterica subsp. enterica serovar Kentucky]|nr:YfcL family protein [Salmonella enterica subsp. enterica serovar Kentucky]
ILALIDDMVEHASDDELFASGYLRGHLTLAIAELESGDDHSVAKAMTTDAQKRLEAIASLEDLGAGFALATHDLEIRGAGELLG